MKTDNHDDALALVTETAIEMLVLNEGVNSEIIHSDFEEEELQFK